MRLLWSSKQQAHPGSRIGAANHRPRGTLVLKSTFHGAADVETWPIVVKELTVVGSRCGHFRPRSLCCARDASIRAR